MSLTESLLFGRDVFFLFMGRTPHQPGNSEGIFRRGPAVRRENVVNPTGEESLLSRALFFVLWGVRPISPESPKGFSGVALPSGEKTWLTPC